MEKKLNNLNPSKDFVVSLQNDLLNYINTTIVQVNYRILNLKLFKEDLKLFKFLILFISTNNEHILHFLRNLSLVGKKYMIRYSQIDRNNRIFKITL